jgi:hypothetical protein
MKLFSSILILFFFYLGVHPLYSKEQQSTVAVVTDISTYQIIGDDLDSYVSSINKHGKKAILIQDIWQHPDSIRQVLKKLYLSSNLEGAVFIGDIPIPMIRDAQHLTSAFKMDQKRDWKQSSVPSDRFYDDFDLEFDYIRKDTDEKLYHYYSLKANSAQSIACDIYSARIKPPVIPGKDKYELLSEYLKKVVKEKEHKEVLSHILHFAGHGYNSESINARIDEAWALKHHFPFLNKKGEGYLDFINFDADPFVKFRLLAKLSDPELDIAILHHHGAEDTQLLGATPHTSNPQQYIEYTKKFFRSKIRSAKDTIEAKRYYITNYNVPESWMNGAFDADIIAADSLFSASMDINIPDTYNRIFNARFIMIDACFTGSFHLDDYISAHYIFNPGRTIAVKANTVNILQDIWPNELIGTLDEGVCLGNWMKETFTLESHLLGDPTFSFTSSVGSQTHIDRDIVKEKNNPGYWRKLFAQTDKPDLKTLSMVMLQKKQAISQEQLLDILKTDADPVVRLEAFTLLKKTKSSLLPQALIIAMTDNYELLKRLGALTAAKSGDPVLLPTLTKLYCNPSTPSRVVFHLKYAFEMYPIDLVAKHFEPLRRENPYWLAEGVYTNFRNGLKRASDSKKEDFEKLGDKDGTMRSKSFTISAQRNLCQPEPLDKLFEYVKNGDNSELRVLTVETLGWYVYSYKREDIIAFCKSQLLVEENAAVRNELQKTIHRLLPDSSNIHVETNI